MSSKSKLKDLVGEKDPQNSPVYAAIDRLVKPVKKPENWDGKLPYITHEGVMEIGKKKLRCYVLNNGMRIFNAEDVESFFNVEK